MTKQYIFYLILFVFFLINSCTEDYQFPNMEKQTTIVITGLVTNEPGPYYVTVWEYISDMTTGNTTQRPINDARVTIADSNGHVDELRPFHSVELEWGLIEDDWGMEFYRHFYDIPDGNGGVMRFYQEHTAKFDDRDGRYFTTSIKGVPGSAYTLKVKYAGQEYTATDYMLYGTVIDSVSLEPIGRYIYNKPGGDDGFLVPCVYFAEPKDETNFYLFDADLGLLPAGAINGNNVKIALKNLALRDWRPDASDRIGDGSHWRLSVISDRFLPPYVYQFKLSDGDYAAKYLNGTDMGFEGWFEWNPWRLKDTYAFINMYNITEPVYRYYYALSQQYYDDGGAFSPSPASPPTNFSGGAQGCFSAASVSQYVLKVNP